MMKMAMIAYNEAVDSEVMEALAHCGLQNYTKVGGVYGRGRTSGTHLGNDIWPGRNNILYVAGETQQINSLVSCVKELRKKIGPEGIKAFVWNLESNEA